MESSTQNNVVAKQGGESIYVWVLWSLPIIYLWFRLIDNLHLEWESNPQYSYGLVMPVLVIGLLLRRWSRVARLPSATDSGYSWLVVGLFAFLAFLYLPTRLVEAATPEWNPIQWMLGVEAIGLTLVAIYIAKGKFWLRQLALPICFFFVAIPWPSLIEQPIIQGLTRFNAGMVVEVMGIVGVPSIQHGNVVEVSTGMVGINDACSGIRSLQSSLMISLFLGEFYLLRRPSRFLFVFLGFILAMAFNLCRASLLTWIAAKKGIAAISEYHDEAGLTILVACTMTLWGVAILLNWRKKPVAAANEQATEVATPANPSARLRSLKKLLFALLVWLVVVEVGVELWYRIREAKIKPGPAWTVVLPEKNPTFKPTPFTPDEHILLRYDDGKQGSWQQPDGTFWQVYYFDWLPGRVAGYLAKRHTPEICLPAVGLKMTAGPTASLVNINGLDLPIRSYVFQGSDGPLQVFQAHWQPGDDEAYADEASRFNLIRGVWAGRGNKGQKSIEVIISGYNDPEHARQMLIEELKKLIVVEKP